MSDSSNTRRRDRIDGNEMDSFAKRGYYAAKKWRAGVQKAIKRKANKRYRRYGKEECRETY